MDLTTIAGLLVALASLVTSVLLDNGSLLALWKPSALVLIVGGTIGATLIGVRVSDLRKLPGIFLSAFHTTKEDPQEIIERLVSMSERARREGLLALQDDVRSIDNSLMARGLQLIVDGTDPEIVRTAMETQVEISEHKSTEMAEVLSTAGGYSPTMGIIGTVMGLVQVLGHLGESDVSELSKAIALAFLATFYGIFLANIFWLPLASKVKQNVAYEALIGRMYIAGITGLQTGEGPRALREKLEVYLSGMAKQAPSRGGGESR